jgi:hypothetical protein
MNSNDQDKGTPISVVIRNRLKEARKRFHANDNISQYIEPGELGQLLDEVEQKMSPKCIYKRCLVGGMPLSPKSLSSQMLSTLAN